MNRIFQTLACDDGRIRLWEVNGDGGILMESSNEPTKMLEVAQNTDRITVVVFHPLAADVMASVSADYVIRIWDTESGAVTVQLEPHPDQVTMSMSKLGCLSFQLSNFVPGFRRGMESMWILYRVRVQGRKGAHFRAPCQ